MTDKPPQWRILDEITAAVYDHPEGFTVPFHENATIADLVWFQRKMAKRLPKYEFAVMRDEQDRLHLTVLPVSPEVGGVVKGSPATSSALAETGLTGRTAECTDELAESLRDNARWADDQLVANFFLNDERVSLEDIAAALSDDDS